MSIFKKVAKDASKTTGNLVGNMASVNAQNSTNAAVDGMDLFRWKMGAPIIQNGHFDQQKGICLSILRPQNSMLMQQGRGCRLVQLSQMFMTKEQRQIY